MTGRARKWLAWEIGAALAVIAVVAAIVVVVDRGDGTMSPAAPPATSRSTTTPAPAAPLTAPALAVKIDNVPSALPQTGLGSADVVYVEPVEGGLTRLVAVYTGTPPAVIGPVRSARRTDIELLGQYGTPVLAYSGAAPELLPALHGARLVNAAPAQAAAAYYRDSDRLAPHNLYVRPARLPDGARGPSVAPLRFGPAPGAGEPTVTEEVRYRAASFAFTWSAADRRWLVSMNGAPLVSTDTGRVTAADVVLQQVEVTTNEGIEDARGTVSPVARTVGSGPVVVLRDGLRFPGTWTRTAVRSPTTFHTPDGRELPLAYGPVWVLLIPS
ncbi:DUF3048 domain-containing protein [Actinophytocola sp. NPDC049390]|uniref:DUF3048 domain-containing protein n=1 Tax=Actinophytocola sp. NPDC049390 TaxID=3363894 RepID=UPI0037AC744A